MKVFTKLATTVFFSLILFFINTTPTKAADNMCNVNPGSCTSTADWESGWFAAREPQNAGEVAIQDEFTNANKAGETPEIIREAGEADSVNRSQIAAAAGDAGPVNAAVSANEDVYRQSLGLDVRADNPGFVRLPSSGTGTITTAGVKFWTTFNGESISKVGCQGFTTVVCDWGPMCTNLSGGVDQSSGKGACQIAADISGYSCIEGQECNLARGGTINIAKPELYWCGANEGLSSDGGCQKNPNGNWSGNIPACGVDVPCGATWQVDSPTGFQSGTCSVCAESSPQNPPATVASGGNPAPPPPTPPPPPGVVSAQCVDIKAFNEDFSQQFTALELATLTEGTIVNFTVAGSATEGLITAARFTINGAQRPPVTTKRSGTEEYFDQYVFPAIPSEGLTISVQAEVQHSTLGWF